MSEDVNVQYLDEKSYAAKYDRQFFRDILTEGIVTSGAFEVTEKGTPDMSVNIAKGRAFVQGDQSEWQGHYGIRNDATVNKAIAASDPTNPRKDRVIAQVYDSVDIGGAEDKYVLEVLTGTPAPSPVVPSLPDDALDLAIIDVAATVTTIVNANITDQRSQIKFQNVIAIGVPQTYTPGPGGTATLDLSLGNEHRITMPAGNITIAVINETNGQAFIVSTTQDAVGSRTVTWFNTIKWPDGSEPTLTTTANKRDTFGCIVTGPDTYDGFIVGQNK